MDSYARVEAFKTKVSDVRNIFPTAPARFHAARARRATRKPAREVTFSGFRTRTTSPIPRWNNTPPFARSRRPPARFDGIEPPKTIHAQKRDHPSVAVVVVVARASHPI